MELVVQVPIAGISINQLSVTMAEIKWDIEIKNVGGGRLSIRLTSPLFFCHETDNPRDKAELLGYLNAPVFIDYLDNRIILKGSESRIITELSWHDSAELKCNVEYYFREVIF